ncbi:MAG TPA: hypothetical protein VM734_36130 [Kofleriaceae bacterium]|nr:hypothetical protein [Kofleriaceae bacterium]
MTRATGAAALAALAALFGCGDGHDDPCAAVAGACLAVRVGSTTVTAIDHLELDVLYGDRHGTTTTQLDGGRVFALPATTAITLEPEPAGPIAVGVVAAGKRSGVVLGTGAASATLGPDQHATIELQLAPPGDCVAGGLYCGGDKLAGDPDTLYRCNGGGVPHARGVCTAGCIVRPTADDACRGDGGVCVDGGHYCGGDKLDGDPQTLYTCQGGVGVSPRLCPDGCVVRPGDDDICR